MIETFEGEFNVVVQASNWWFQPTPTQLFPWINTKHFINMFGNLKKKKKKEKKELS